MTYSEKRAKLEKNRAAKVFWVIILVASAISIFGSILVALGLGFTGYLLGSNALGIFSIIAAILVIAIGGFIFYSIWRLQRWVLWLIWISAGMSIINLSMQSKSVLEILPLLIALGYTYIQQFLNSKEPIETAQSSSKVS